MNRQFGAFTGIAMMLIVLNHSISLGLDALNSAGITTVTGWGLVLLSTLQAFGAFAVPIFFFISGSFVAYAAQGDPPKLSRKFLWSSLRHILFPYLIWSAVFYLVIFFQRQEIYSPLGYAKNLIVGYPYHFIPLLMFFYLFSPLLVIISKRYGLALLLLIGLYQLFSINVVYPGTLGITFPEWTKLLTPPVLRTTIADWAIYFPFGLVYGLHTKQMLPWMKRNAWWLLVITVVIFIIGMLDAFKVVTFPLARFLCPLTFILALPAITRDRIPFVRSFEKLGKRSYGLYLTHLIVLDLTLLLFKSIVAWVLGLPWLLIPLLFVLGLLVPMGIMELAARGPTRRVYRYLFG